MRKPKKSEKQKATEKARKLASATRRLANGEKLNKERLEQKELIDYFTEVYDISLYPNYLLKRLVYINEGTYSGLTVAIPYSLLLEMFKHYNNELNSLYLYNSNHGKQMERVYRLAYDLAYVLNHYDEYMAIKKQEEIITQNAESAKENLIGTDVLENIKKTEIIKQKDELDMSYFLDEDDDEEE